MPSHERNFHLTNNLTSESMRIRIGTRQSPLALWQANHVTSLLTAAGHEVELVKIATTGDVTTTPLGSSGGVGVFTKEIQRALLDDRCDLAVHSLKDLPTQPVEGLQLTAVPEREEIADCLISRKYQSLLELPAGAKVGTGSPRRQAQLLRLRPDLVVTDIRGNVQSRLDKLDAEQYDAILLAYAGLHRLGFDQQITQRFTSDELLPAVGQGALGLETRRGDEEINAVVQALSHGPSHFAVVIERTTLRTLRAGCLTPLAAHATIHADSVRLSARVFSSDYSEMIEQHWSWPFTSSSASAFDLSQAEAWGQQAASDLTELGADELIHPEEVDYLDNDSK